MATASPASTDTKKGNTPGASAPSRFKKIETDRYMFNPNKGCTGSLIGYLLGVVDMPPMQRGKDKDGTPIMQTWQCLLFKSTEVCKGIGRDKDAGPIDVPVGSEVLVPATFVLDNALAKAAMHPTAIVEVQVTPKKKISIGNGQTMWVYDLGYDPDSKKTRASFGPTAEALILKGVESPRQLTAGEAQAAIAAGNVTAEEDLPFA
jgi:hypothetical protein